jgi:hypothetical protein
MTTSPTESSPNRKPTHYRSLVPLGGAGVILLVLGFIIGLTWLAWLGLICILATAFLTKLWFFGDWAPTLLAAKEHDHENPWHLPPPPTLKDRL